MSLRLCVSGRLGNALPQSKVVKFFGDFYAQKSLMRWNPMCESCNVTGLLFWPRKRLIGVRYWSSQ
uniref:Uncharacterized protein n=1 Tax=Anguilla anguilla TaxID=7936 RepID=A0A0E9WCQ5_ANGAN